MDHSLNLADLKDAFREVLDKESDIEAVRSHVASGCAYHSGLWRVAANLGWTALPASEQHGGLGLGLDALAILYLELGRSLAPIPLTATLIAADVIIKGGDVAQQALWLPQIVGGSLRASLSSPFSRPSVKARQEGDSLVLNGLSEHLLDGAGADVLLVLVSLDGAPRYVIIDSQAAGDQLAIIPTIDQTRTLASFTLRDFRVPADRALMQGDVVELLEVIGFHASLAIAADSVGGAAAILARTIEYLKVREQFGRPIGSFQALKHRAADHQTALTAAELLLDDVIVRIGGGDATMTDVLAVKALAASVYEAIARDCIQLHGGIGFTSEYPAHFYLKRALLNSELFSSRAETLDLLVRSLVS